MKVDRADQQVHVCEVRRGPDGDADCRAIATLHNAYPAMAAELRALREVAEAARAFVPRCAVLCREPATHESVGGIYLCDAHTARHRDLGGHADPLALGAALRAALAKVPR